MNVLELYILFFVTDFQYKACTSHRSVTKCIMTQFQQWIIVYRGKTRHFAGFPPFSCFLLTNRIKCDTVLDKQVKLNKIMHGLNIFVPCRSNGNRLKYTPAKTDWAALRGHTRQSDLQYNKTKTTQLILTINDPKQLYERLL